MLAASEQFVSDQLENFVMVGELALTGAVRSVKGALPIAIRAKAEGKIGLLVPKDNAAEAAVVKGLQVISIQNLREAVGFLEGEVKISPTRVDLARVFDGKAIVALVLNQRCTLQACLPKRVPSQRSERSQGGDAGQGGVRP